MRVQETRPRETVGSARASSVPNPWSPDQALFFKEGEYWTLGYAGHFCRVKDRQGLAHLAQLLRSPGREFHALDLVRGNATGPLAGRDAAATVASTGQVHEADLHIGNLGDAGEWLDAQAKASYRHRLAELHEELQAAKALGHIARAEAAEREVEALVAELAHATGLGGRDRRAASAAERARQSVSRAIKLAVDTITGHLPELGHHLARSIKTGTYCCYTPDPAVTITWDFTGKEWGLALASPHEGALGNGATSSHTNASPRMQVGARLAALPQTAFVNRQQETTRLRGLVDRARYGQGAVVLLGGSMGVGKTRLATEVAAYAADQGFLSLSGHCYEREEPCPYLPFAEILETALAQAPSPQEFRQWLGDTAAELALIMPRLRRLFPDIPMPPELPPQQLQCSLFQSLTECLARASSQTPLFLILDDLQWADEATLALVHYLATRVGQLPVVIVGTYRDSRLDTSPALGRTLEELLRLGLRPLKLQGLCEEAVGQLLRSLSHREPPQQLVRVMFAETHGNPFLVEELYRHLVAEGKMFDAAGALRTDVSAAEIGVPDTVRLVLERRLERLGAEVRTVLTAAAVLGPSFRFDLLQALQDHTTLDDLLIALEQAQRLGLLVPSAGGQEASFMFAHDLMRQTLLASMSVPRRQLLHVRAAEALAQGHTAMESQHAVTIA
jgi:AAA ATPase domain